MKKIILIIVAILIIIVGIYGFIFINELYGDSTKNGQDITITIPEGSSTHTIAKILKENDFIKIERAFIMRVNRLRI